MIRSALIRFRNVARVVRDYVMRVSVMHVAVVRFVGVVRLVQVVTAGELLALLIGERLHVSRGQADLPLVRVDLDDARAHRLADMKDLVELLPVVA